ncbi:MAG: Mce family protein [Marmoricola sp.]|nr:Mce family protein [Marmoricola sp.]
MTASIKRRALRIAALTTAAGITMMTAGSCAQYSNNRSTAYCALLPDSVGLYVGNPVTQMGYQIGKVTTINPGTTDVRVEFTMNSPRPLPSDVKAIIRSTSILADRSLELVGNYEAGPQLAAGGCIPLNRSSTPKSLSEVIGSATQFINSVNPDGSSNLGDVVKGLDQATQGAGTGINQLLTTSSAVLDSPDQAIDDISSITTNLGHLTSVLTEIRGPLKEILQNAEQTTPDGIKALDGGYRLTATTIPLVGLVSDLETNLGGEIQFLLDAVGVALRKGSAHAPRLANLLNPVPWWINTLANNVNNRTWNLLRYRPPLYRIQTPDGIALCNIMNASTPGSCANVQGQPYAADVALLQYVLTEAANR